MGDRERSKAIGRRRGREWTRKEEKGKELGRRLGEKDREVEGGVWRE